MASTLPSFESLKSSGRHVRPSIDFIRLRWWLSGPVSTKIKVLASAFDPTSPQSPYKSGEDDAPTFHPIFESPVSHPPVSSIRVTVSCLDNWAESWADEHWDCVFGTPQQGQELERCCDEDRPGPGPSLTVSAGDGRPFVTIHDYVMAVHSWLLALEPDIRAVLGHGRAFPLAARYDIHVVPTCLSPLYLSDSGAVKPASYEIWCRRHADLAAKWRAEEEREAREERDVQENQCVQEHQDAQGQT